MDRGMFRVPRTMAQVKNNNRLRFNTDKSFTVCRDYPDKLLKLKPKFCIADGPKNSIP
jgi:hypothetical protein